MPACAVMNADLIYSSSDSDSSPSLMFPGLTSSFPDKYWIVLDVFLRLFELLLFLCLLVFLFIWPLFYILFVSSLMWSWAQGSSINLRRVFFGNIMTHFRNVPFMNVMNTWMQCLCPPNRTVFFIVFHICLYFQVFCQDIMVGSLLLVMQECFK